jgi:hypothetical protein
MKKFFSKLTPYNVLQLLIQIIGFSVFIFIFLGIINRSDNTAKIVSAEGLQELNKTRHSIAQLAINSNAVMWGLGSNKTTSENQWIYNGAYIILPDCIEYRDFQKALLTQRFKHKPPFMTASYCKNDVSIDSIEPESTQEIGHDQTRKYLICGKISFTYAWKKDQNINDKSCYD